MPDKIGILCAGDDEVAPILSLLQGDAPSQQAMLTFHAGKLAGMDVVALYSGVCKVNAAIAAQLLLTSYGCTHLLNVGTAGGMDPNLRIFDTVVGLETAYWDVAADILTDFHPWMESVFFQADSRLVALARQAAARWEGPPVVFGRMATGECFIEDDRRAAIRAALQPLSVDMESASVAHVCHAHRVPFLSIRTLTDTAEHAGLDAFEQNCAQASQLAARFTQALLQAWRRP